jgi:hypothetical protein
MTNKTCDRYAVMFKINIRINYVRFQVLTAASVKFRVFWDVLPCSQIDVDRQAARTSETSVDIELRTRQCIPEDSELRTSELLRVVSVGDHPET